MRSVSLDKYHIYSRPLSVIFMLCADPHLRKYNFCPNIVTDVSIECVLCASKIKETVYRKEELYCNSIEFDDEIVCLPDGSAVVI